METFIGTKITLRHSSMNDRMMVWDWSTNSDIMKWVNDNPNTPQTYKEFCSSWKNHYFDGSNLRLGRIFIIEKDSIPIGMIAYNDFDEKNHRTEIDIWLSSEKECGHGYGTDAIKTLIKYIKNKFNLLEAWAQPTIKNKRSVKAFIKAGFKEKVLINQNKFLEYGERDFDDSILLIKKL